MKLLVGLGNPGLRYAGTRHNVGFRVAERFAARHHIPLDERRFRGRFGRARIALGAGTLDVGVLEPQTWMNRSGDALEEALPHLPCDASQDLLVVLDDVDLPFGRLRIRRGGGAGGHRGLAHLLERLGRSDIPRLRFGVGRPPPPLDTTEYVLRDFSPEEQEALDERLLAAVEAVERVFTLGLDAAMNLANRPPPTEPEL